MKPTPRARGRLHPFLRPHPPPSTWSPRPSPLRSHATTPPPPPPPPPTRTVRSIAALLSSTPTAAPAPTPPPSLTIHGFIRSIRKQKRVAFAVLADGSTTEPLQVVLSPAQAEGLSTGAGVRLTGQWVACAAGREQSHELQATAVTLLGAADAGTYPLQKKQQSNEYLRTMPHLRLRTPFNALLLRLRSHAIGRVTAFFAARGFVHAHPPVISSSDCEGAGEVFRVLGSTEEAEEEVEVGAAADPGAAHAASASASFFRTPRYLTVSAQLHLEAVAQAVGHAWALAPAFRADRSDTARHLAEFYMLEAEMAFVDDVAAVMALVEALVRDLVRSVRDSPLGSELLRAKGHDGVEEDGVEDGGGAAAASSSASSAPVPLLARWHGILHPTAWPRIAYATAIDRLQAAVASHEARFAHAPSWTGGLHAEHERFLARVYGGNGGGGGGGDGNASSDGAAPAPPQPVFITDYPRALKPFYMAPSAAPAPAAAAVGVAPTVACFDLLVPGIGEIAGGSVREHRLPQLLEAMRRAGLLLAHDGGGGGGGGPAAAAVAAAEADDDDDERLIPDGLRWYVDLRRWGSVPHAGFGLGFDRLLAYVAGVRNVKDVVTWPRWAGRCDC
ncbi:MAG: asparaginyl-tRNA synthetase [Phylliscum demangeonii]|nr:MAG: asparaginyl-tRNA synthetase [Phylliscum demangeonii]